MDKTGTTRRPPITTELFDAVLFDLDGVLTATSEIHAASWRVMLEELRRRHPGGDRIRPFEMDTDYYRVDGRPRYDGARSLLDARNIQLPWGDPAGPPGYETVCGLGNRKDEIVHGMLMAEGIQAYSGSTALVHQVRSRGLKTAVVSSSRNCEMVLRAAGILDLFDVLLDGDAASRLNLPGKPAPDTFMKAAEQLGAEPSRAVVVEDAISGVQAGRAGGFGLVIGVDRTGNGAALRENGADVVVADLSELVG